MSIIGKSYIPFDNSYTICLSESIMSRHPKPYFAGTANTPPIGGATIVSEPYVQGIVHESEAYYSNGVSRKIQEVTSHVFVNILYNGHTYRVLYRPGGVDRIVPAHSDIDKW